MRQSTLMKRLLATLLAVVLTWGVTSCSQPEGVKSPAALLTRNRVAEVSPPYVLQNLKQMLEIYQPQVKIVSPRSNQTLEDTEIELKLQVNDLPLFKDADLGLGPYIQIWLDNQPYTQVYDLSEPLKLENLAPGTHTLRAFAVRPWHESFKNEGAFAQTTFHIFTPTPDNNPEPGKPLLTYNYPLGVYGAEPVLLDFHLTNAPLHLVARENAQDAIPDWKIRCTINGESFSFDRWEPIYLKGLKSGKNWVQLELLDDEGQVISNVFNTAVQLVTYEPGGSDTLAKITRGELTVEEVGKIVDPNYMPPPPPPVFTPEPEPIPDVPSEPTLEPELPSELEPQPLGGSTAPEAGQPNSEPEVILEPDLTQQPSPEMMPPEVVPVEPKEFSQPKVIEPELEPKLKPELELDFDRLNSAEPQLPDLQPDFAKQPAIEPLETPDLPIAPAFEKVPEEIDQPSVQQKVNLIEIPLNEEVTKVAPRSAADERESDQLKPLLTPPLAPSIPLTPSFIEPDADLSAEARRKAVEDQTEPEWQPTELIVPESVTEPELFQPAAAEPVPLAPASPLQPEALIPSADLPTLEVNSPAVSARANPVAPNLVGVFDQVQGFFEGLRKQPAKAPLLNSLFEASNLNSSEPIEQLPDSVLSPQSTDAEDSLSEPASVGGGL